MLVIDIFKINEVTYAEKIRNRSSLSLGQHWCLPRARAENKELHKREVGWSKRWFDGDFAEFAGCKASGASADSAGAQALVVKLQIHITANYYTCTDEILAGLGKMYVDDERFKKNIDKYGEGTAEFAAEAIAAYVK